MRQVTTPTAFQVPVAGPGEEGSTRVPRARKDGDRRTDTQHTHTHTLTHTDTHTHSHKHTHTHTHADRDKGTERDTERRRKRESFLEIPRESRTERKQAGKLS